MGGSIFQWNEKIQLAIAYVPLALDTRLKKLRAKRLLDLAEDIVEQTNSSQWEEKFFRIFNFSLYRFRFRSNKQLRIASSPNSRWDWHALRRCPASASSSTSSSSMMSSSVSSLSTVEIHSPSFLLLLYSLPEKVVGANALIGPPLDVALVVADNCDQPYIKNKYNTIPLGIGMVGLRATSISISTIRCARNN